MVGRIGKMLRFHAKGISGFICPSPFASDAAGEVVRSVKLQPRLSGMHFQDASAIGVIHARQESELAGFLVKDPTMIVAAAEL